MYKQIKYFLNIFAHKFLKLYVYRGLQSTVENELVQERATLGVVHKLSWQDFDIFEHLPLCLDIFYGMNVDRKWTFLDHLPRLVNVVCERPLCKNDDEKLCFLK